MAQGRVALVELLDADLSPVGQPAATGDAPHVVTVRVLGPQLSATVEGEPVTGLRGYPAKLLAVLVASGGVLTVDAAIEGLWPDAELAVGRNRLHGILLRLRRTLGLPASGPITCADDLIRLGRDGSLVVDSWALEQADPASDLPPAWRAVASYGEGVLTHQFAYDDAIEAYRRSMRAAFLRTAAELLADPTTAPDLEAAAALACRVGRLAPDDEQLCLLAVDVLARDGRTIEASDVVRRTAQTLDNLGVDATSFTTAARRLTSREPTTP
jgi:DNA-binding SARP family transcriptional activator